MSTWRFIIIIYFSLFSYVSNVRSNATLEEFLGIKEFLGNTNKLVVTHYSLGENRVISQRTLSDEEAQKMELFVKLFMIDTLIMYDKASKGESTEPEIGTTSRGTWKLKTK